jgi:hypothetical protein
VSLLPGMGTPIYEVIVGYLKTAEHVERLNKHLEPFPLSLSRG